MKIQFNSLVAKSLSLDEAIILGWLENDYNYSPIHMKEVETIFTFWHDEHLYQLLAQLEAKGILQVRRDAQGNCLFGIHSVRYLELVGFAFQQPLPSTPVPVIDTNLKRHLQRFQNNDSLLNKKLSKLISENYQPMIDYAIAEGLTPELAKSSFDKFLHYVSSHPDKFWNTDLTGYWGYWVSNNKDRQKLTVKGQGKRSAVERSNQHAGASWLKKKQASTVLHTSVQITQDK